MQPPITIGLVGDYNPDVPAHRAIPHALARASDELGLGIGFQWVPSEEISSVARIADFDGLWGIPASPYRNMDGVLLAIRHARESGIPYLGTCGGCQHAIIEYARNVLGWIDANHAETSPEAARAVIAPLACALVDATGTVDLVPGSRLATIYAGAQATEGYRCSFGVNEAFRDELLRGPLRLAATDADDGEVRAVELDKHPFFVATLFQPERAALRGESAPLINAFAAACAE
ncbi:MAG: CTP synthase [Acidihalobacter sp.]